MKKCVCLILLGLFFLQIKVFAQSLDPARTTFSVDLSIILSLEEVRSQYGGNPFYPNTTFSVEHPLGLEGRTPQYLKISWKASYSDGVARTINVFCYLNTMAKNCSYPNYRSGTVGSCMINDTEYNYTNFNLVVCNFSSIDFPQLYGTVNRSLQPVAFIISTAPTGVSVGKAFNWEVNVKNLGVLDSNFNINITYNPSKVSVNPFLGDTPSVAYGLIATFISQVNFLVAGDHTLTIYTRPLSNPMSCSSNLQCSPAIYTNPVCMNNLCWSKHEVNIKVNLASLPEFGFLGIVQIMIFLVIIFMIISRKRKK